MKNNKRGIILAEIVVAMAIIALATVSILQFYISSLYLSEANKEDAIATTHLTNMAEAIKCTPFSNITSDFPNGTADGPSGNEYTTLVGGYLLTGEQITVSYANPASDPLEITVSVNWQHRGGINRTRYLVTERTR